MTALKKRLLLYGTLIPAGAALVLFLARRADPPPSWPPPPPPPLEGILEITLDVLPDDPIRMDLNPRDSVLTHTLLKHRIWEPRETAWFLHFLRKGDTVLDIGANVGYYTLIAAKRAGEAGRVYAFEPDPESFEILERNLRINGLSNVTAEQKAVSSQKGTLTLYLASRNKADHRIYRHEDSKSAVQVEAVPLDDYFRGHDRRVDVVKIDTQGAEALILKGMEGLLRRNPDAVIFIEFWPHGLKGLGNTGQELLDLLKSHDLLTFDLGASSPDTGDLPPADESRLLADFTPENRRFANLLAVKGRAEYERLSRGSDAKALEDFRRRILRLKQP